jgi:3-hydroxypropionyl-CoA synthetase (ADP-forming)
LEFVAAKEIGIRSFFSYGNRVDVDEGDLIEYFAEDPNTKVMGFYIEALSDGRKLVNRAKNVVNQKPIVIYKAGKTEQGAKAALSHTGWLSKSPQVNEGILSQAGIILAKNFQQQCAMINALVRQPPARGPNIAFVSNGIGPCVGAIDLIQENSLQLAELRPESIEEMEKAYPYYYIPQNPVDVTGSATSRDYEIAIQVLMQDPNVDLCMPYFVFQDTPLDEGIVEVLENAKHEGKPILVGAIGGPYTKQMSAQIEMKGIPVFSAVGDWVAAAEALYLHGKNLGLSK